MRIDYKRISQSWVAEHPSPKGVVLFYGSPLFGQTPTVSYGYFLETLYNAEYTIVAIPFQFGFNHVGIAEGLLAERDEVRQEISGLDGLPTFWVGHGLGCKHIALLEVFTDPESNAFLLKAPESDKSQRQGILNEPSLLIAPEFADSNAMTQFPVVSTLLNWVNFGAYPSKAELKKLIEESNLFQLTGLISFEQDLTSGSINDTTAEKDAAWFFETLSKKVDQPLLHREVSGEHDEPLGFRVGGMVMDIDLSLRLTRTLPREIEPVTMELLEELAARCGGARPAIQAKKSEPAKPVEIKKTESVKPVEIKKTKPAKPVAVRKEDPVKPVEVKKPEPAKPVAVKKADPVKPVAVKKADPAKPVAVKKADPAKPVAVKKADPAKPVAVKKADPVKPVEVKKPEPAKPVEIKKTDPAKPVEVKKPEPVKPVEVKKAGPAKPAEVKKAESVKPVEAKKTAVPKNVERQKPAGAKMPSETKKPEAVKKPELQKPAEDKKPVYEAKSLSSSESAASKTNSPATFSGFKKKKKKRPKK